jgi:hypothetical protein
MKATHFLSEYGKICNCDLFKDLDLRVSNISEKERMEIFNTFFLCESIKNMQMYDFGAIAKNKSYALDTNYVDGLIKRNKYYFLWQFTDQSIISLIFNLLLNLNRKKNRH